MAKSDNLRQAKTNKNDEFYTRLKDLEDEISQHADYVRQFDGKVVLCNCDDPKSHTNSLMVKFGSKQHLLELQQGIVFLNSVVSYRQDETYGRGDEMDGAVPVCTDGWYIESDDGLKFDMSIGEAFLSFEQDKHIFAFCASMIDPQNAAFDDTGRMIAFKKEFLNEMKSFGEYALVFDFLSLKSSLLRYHEENNDILFKADKVVYKSKNELRSLTACDFRKWMFSRFFAKEITRFAIQNEYRVIAYSRTSLLQANCNTGLKIHTNQVLPSKLFTLEELMEDALSVSI